MNNLQKFNNTIEEFDKELIKLKDTSEAYQRLQGLVSSYAKIKEDFALNSKSLGDIAKLQNKRNEDFTTQTEMFEKNLMATIEKLRKDNKDFYLDFEKTVKIKLDENRIEIKQLIENERYRIKEMFEVELSKTREAILSKQKVVQVTLWILGFILIILNIVVLMKVLK